MTQCNLVRETASLAGARALRAHPTAWKHLSECDACFSFVEAVGELDAMIAQAPAPDAPDQLVDRTLARVRADGEAVSTPPGIERRRRRWLIILGATGLPAAAAAVLMVAIGSSTLNNAQAPPRVVVTIPETIAGDVAASSDQTLRVETAPGDQAIVITDGERWGGKEGGLKFHYRAEVPTPELGWNSDDGRDAEAGNSEAPETIDIPRQQIDRGLDNLSQAATQARIVPSFQNGEPTGFKLFSVKPDSLYAKLGLRNGDVVERINGRAINSPDKALRIYGELKDTSEVEVDVSRRGEAVKIRCRVPEADVSIWRCRSSGQDPEQEPTTVASSSTLPSTAARDFLERYANTDVGVREASGYWANTYLPGDPTLSILRARLAQHQGQSPRLAEAAQLPEETRPSRQPFDPSANAALAVFLNASEASVSERQRMILQVGLQATPRHSGRRPMMNVGVVLDLRTEVDPETGVRMRALLTALAQAHEGGDRFSLIVAGRGGGMVLDAERFRSGPLSLVMQDLFQNETQPETPSVSIEAALQTAYAVVGGVDDPGAPLGSSLVLLVTGAPGAGGFGELAPSAHAQAVEGIPLSVMMTQPGTAVDELAELALAGQGNRRLLTRSADAVRLVDQELAAVSRVVARAVRLRIRLAAGVELVDVIGSERLDQTKTERARHAEQSIDRRMARNSGIAADRGDDEEGIQILIPGFYAGDSHVILLDVIASGPGAIADVTARYKDLVFLNNGVASAHLTLDQRPVSAGHLEQRVVANLLAQELSWALARAAEHLSHGRRDGALGQIRQILATLTGMKDLEPGLKSDRTLAADIALLRRFETLLSRQVIDDPVSRRQLTNSLHLASLLKLRSGSASR